MGDLSHAFGYSGARDPDFRYCVQSLRDAGSGYDGYVLDGCGLTGGCSGGPQVCFSCEMLSTVYIYKSLKDCIIWHCFVTSIVALKHTTDGFKLPTEMAVERSLPSTLTVQSFYQATWAGLGCTAIRHSVSSKRPRRSPRRMPMERASLTRTPETMRPSTTWEGWLWWWRQRIMWSLQRPFYRRPVRSGLLRPVRRKLPCEKGLFFFRACREC